MDGILALKQAIRYVNAKLRDVNIVPMVYKSIPIEVANWGTDNTYRVTYEELATCTTWDLMIDDDSPQNTFEVREMIVHAGIDAVRSGDTLVIKYTQYKPTAQIVLKLRMA